MSDISQQQQIEKRIMEATRKLNQMAAALGAAKQIIEFAPDRRKNCLAKHHTRHIKEGYAGSATGAEAFARADPLYLEEIKQIEEQVKDAYDVRAEWDATMCSFEAGRSLLAMTRETMKTLEG